MKQKLRNLDSFHRNHGDHSKAKTPRTPSSNNVEQSLPGENTSSSKWNSIVLPMLVKDHQQEEDQLNLHHPNRKPSVLSKVKEKAKKWRQTLARKKQGQEDNTQSPSKKAPLEEENANNGFPLHLRSSSKLHALDNHRELANNQSFSKPDHSKSLNPSSSMASHSHKLDEIQKPSPRKTSKIQDEEKDRHLTLASMSGLEADEVPMALQSANVLGAIESPLTSLILEERGKTPSPTPMPNAFEANEEEHTMTLAEAVTEKLAPAYAAFGSAASEEEVEEDEYEEYKGVSVKEYLRKELEPGDEEKALNWVISEVMDNGDKGVMEKVKEAMTSLLDQEEDEDDEEEEEDAEEQQRTRWHSSSSSPQIPLSTNAYEAEEENHGRILQAN